AAGSAPGVRPAPCIQVSIPPVTELQANVLPGRLLTLLAFLCGIQLNQPSALVARVDSNQQKTKFPLFDAADVAGLVFTCKLMTTIPALGDGTGAGNFEEAEKFYRNELQIKEGSLGKTHPQVALTLANLAELYANSNNPKKAGRVFSRAAFIMKKK